MAKLKVDDEVIVLTGKDKGKTGSIQKVFANGKVIVSGVNRIKKHQKPNPNLQIAGGIIEKEAAINSSNIAILNPETNKADKIGFKFDENGSKQRIYKSSGQTIEVQASE